MSDNRKEMKILSIQEAYLKKFESQKRIPQLEYHAAGCCAHIGKLSLGCKTCFIPDTMSLNLYCGFKCDLECPYCPNKGKMLEKDFMRNIKLRVLRWSCLPNFSIQKISFTGGEPLLYMEVINAYMKFFHSMEKYMQHKPRYYIYTNGTHANRNNLVQLKDMGFDEIRFHLGASDFAKKVYKNIASAKRYFKVISVETPAWPMHRKKLFEMLPIIEDIGVNHLNVGEIEIKQASYKTIARVYPGGQVYYSYGLHLYDGGLVYDIIEEVIRKEYSYSVLDCNCFVKSIQRTPAKFVHHEDVSDLCAEY